MYDLRGHLRLLLIDQTTFPVLEDARATLRLWRLLIFLNNKALLKQRDGWANPAVTNTDQKREKPLCERIFPLLPLF